MPFLSRSFRICKHCNKNELCSGTIFLKNSLKTLPTVLEGKPPPVDVLDRSSLWKVGVCTESSFVQRMWNKPMQRESSGTGSRTPSASYLATRCIPHIIIRKHRKVRKIKVSTPSSRSPRKIPSYSRPYPLPGAWGLLIDSCITACNGQISHAFFPWLYPM